FIRPGQTHNGDSYVVLTVGNRVLVGVVGGLGYGADSAAAAKRTVAEIREYVGDESLISVVRRCHARLRETRGVALSLALFQPDNSTMTWIGVGNVEGRLLRSETESFRKPETLLLRAGTVGIQLPGLLTSTVPVVAGDILIFATDGLDRNFVDGLSVNDDPQRLCDRIMATHSKKTDDAVVVAVRYIG
ncbi:MAG: stage II sporulation protein E (SpoIIE), partial [Rhodospirillaceae bacterium]